MTPKERAAELSAKLRDAAKMQDPLAQAVVELVKLISDEAKESLVMAVGDDMLRQQGAAQRLRQLHRELTTAPPTIARTE
jgi:hypothetical protein